MQATELEGTLLDQATILLLSNPLDVSQAALLIGKLRTCANQSHEIKDANGQHKLRELADRLERRLLAT